MDIRDTDEYKSGEFSIVSCPVCGGETLDNYYICPHCMWEYDGITNDYEYSSANHSTIEEYRARFNGK